MKSLGESKATEAYRDCYNCDGEGYINDSECPMCSGSGLIKKYDWEDVPDADTNFLPPEIVYGESEATEGGLGSGRGGHEPWMKEITELKANKHSIPSKNMTSNRFLKELASEDYGGLSGLRGITFKECPTCSGMGEVDDKFNLPYNRKFLEQNPDIEFGLPKECPDCGGKGQISEIDFGESKARETDADIAQAEADRVCPIC